MLLLSVTSCIWDNNSECRRDITFVFRYDYNMQYTDRFREQINMVQLYIYDEHELLAKHDEIPASNLIDGQKVSLELSPGKYTAIAWGYNHEENFISYDTDTMTHMKTEYKAVEDGTTRTALPGFMFHGRVSFEVNDKNQTEIMSMIKNTNNIKVIIRGLNKENGTKVEIEADNASYQFDNSLTANETIRYEPLTTVISDSIQATFQILRLVPNDMNVILHVDKTDNSNKTIQPIIQMPIIPLLLRNISMNPDEYLDRQDSYTIRITIQTDGNIITESWDEIHTNETLK